MSPAEHYAEAERLLAKVDEIRNLTADGAKGVRTPEDVQAVQAAVMLGGALTSAALVHATLAAIPIAPCTCKHHATGCPLDQEAPR